MTCLTPDYTEGPCHCPGCDPSSYARLLNLLDDPLKGVTAAAVARPGDTVIIAFEGELSPEDIAQLEQGFEHLTRKGIEVAFTDQVRSMIVVSEADDINDWGGA